MSLNNQVKSQSHRVDQGNFDLSRWREIYRRDFGSRNPTVLIRAISTSLP